MLLIADLAVIVPPLWRQHSLTSRTHIILGRLVHLAVDNDEVLQLLDVNGGI